jgi:hypothetical protein
MANMKGARIAEALAAGKEHEVDAVVGDPAGGHRTQSVREGGVVLVEQPAGSPELNPAAQVCEELRRRLEGQVYVTIDEKVAALARVTQFSRRGGARAPAGGVELDHRSLPGALVKYSRCLRIWY